MILKIARYILGLILFSGYIILFTLGLGVILGVLISLFATGFWTGLGVFG